MVLAAIEACNRGDTGALTAACNGAAGARIGAKPRCGSLDATLALEDGTISVRRVSCLDDRRVFCSLVTETGIDFVGIYCVDDGRITDARHYFSDVELLISVGILEEDPEIASAAPPR